MIKTTRARRGTVLILVLWALGLLTVFAVNIGLQVRQRGQTVQRLDHRARLQTMAASGARAAMAVLAMEPEGPLPWEPSDLWRLRHDNPASFSGLPVDQGQVDVSYRLYDESGPQTRFGVVDEERKININTADRETLSRLLGRVLGLEEQDSGPLAGAVIDWRQYGDTEIVGFYSDEYYQNLEHPYPEKKTPFEHPEELLLVRGITPEVYARLADFVTVYGDGRVNINTAPPPVLWALGFDDGLIQKVLVMRRGADRTAGTADDRILQDAGELTSALLETGDLSPQEARMIAEASARGPLDVREDFFRIESRARLTRGGEGRHMDCVFQLSQRRVVYWREY